MKNLATLLVKKTDGAEMQLEGDGDTGALKIIESEHAKIHDGYSFSASYSTTTAATDDHRTGISFTTPAASVGEMHAVFTATASHAAEVTLSEAPTLDSDPGANVAPYNRNRNSTVTSICGSSETTPTLNEYTTLTEAQIAGGTFTAGTNIAYEVLVAGGGPKALGGASRAGQEWELKAATKYIFWVQNIGNNANTHVLNMDWYEVV